MPQKHHEQLVTVPPDGGWAWVITAVGFLGIIIIDMPCMSFQVVVPFLLETLHASKPSVTIIFSTYTLLMQLLGPVAGGICNRFGFRIAFIIGSVLMVVGLLPIFWISNYVLTVFLYGVIAGSGSSFILIVSAVAPGFWFERKRPIALGIVSSATGFSVLSINISQFCSDKLGWRYCFILWAIIISLTGSLSVLLYPPPMIELQGQAVVENVPMRSVTAMDLVNTKKIKNIEKMESAHEIPNRIMSRISEQSGVPVPSTSQKVSDEYTRRSSCCPSCCNCFGKAMAGSRPLYRKDIFYQGNLDQASELNNTPREAYTLPLSKLPTVQDVKEEREGHWKIPEAVSRAVSEMIDLSLLKSAVFLLLVLATFLFYTAVYIPFLQLKRVNEGKMEECYRLMIPILMGAGVTTFRLLVGFMLYFFPSISALLIIVIASFASGLIFLSVMLSHATPYQIGFAFFGGAFPSIINPLRSVVIIEKLGLDRLTSCMGMLFFVQGIACFIGLLFAELLIEGTGSIYAGLVFCSICFILSGMVFALIGIMNKFKK
ncbi:unnamed protein product [Nezara viridula]|uniref:Uncharacterized protein n=1 Tax=Nezara viridula TaxID=85310 RepID=A0A9P0E1F8_NEZVI|nr:unnamed protein product [Nezara viridula]